MFKMSSLNLGTVDILGCAMLCCRAGLWMVGYLATYLTSAHLWQLKTSPDVDRPLLGGKFIFVWEEQVGMCVTCVCCSIPDFSGDRWGCVTCACCSIPGFNGSEDCAALEQLLEGYDQQDQDQVSEVCNSPLFKYMDNDVSGLLVSFLLSSCMEEASSEIFFSCGLVRFFSLYFLLQDISQKGTWHLYWLLL